MRSRRGGVSSAALTAARMPISLRIRNERFTGGRFREPTAHFHQLPLNCPRENVSPLTQCRANSTPRRPLSRSPLR